MSKLSCSVCNWTNVSLLNLGEPDKPLWVCQGCCKRAIDDNAKLRKAMIQLRDCDWVITLSVRMDAVRKIAREALQ